MGFPGVSRKPGTFSKPGVNLGKPEPRFVWVKPQLRSCSTTIQKIRAHTHVRGNDLADAAAKLAVTDFDTLPNEQTLRVDIGAIAPRPPF